MPHEPSKKLPPRQNHELPPTVELPTGRNWSPRSIEWADRIADGVVRTAWSVLGPVLWWALTPKSTGGFFTRVGCALVALMWLGWAVGPQQRGLAVTRPPAATHQERLQVAPVAAGSQLDGEAVAAAAAPPEPSRGPEAVAIDRDPFAPAKPGKPAIRYDDQQPVPGGGWVYAPKGKQPSGQRPQPTTSALVEKLKAEYVPIRPGQKLWLVIPLQLQVTTEDGAIQPIEIAANTQIDWVLSEPTGDLIRIVDGVGAGLEFWLQKYTIDGHISNIRPPGVAVSETGRQTTAKGRKAQPKRASLAADRAPVTDAERARSLVQLAKQLADSGKVAGARKRLEEVLEKYADSEAADAARQALESLPAE